jgi:hypothetical protein
MLREPEKLLTVAETARRLCAPALLARKGGQMPKMPPPTGAGSKSVPVSTKITKKPA